MDEQMVCKGNWQKFLTLGGENLLLVKRKHPYVLILPIVLTILIGGMFIFADFLLFLTLHFTFTLFLTTVLLLINIGISIITKSILDWFFHIYILTTRRIFEIFYT